MPKVISDKNNLQVLYEDNHIIVVNKRPGDIVQGDKTGDKPLSEIVKEYIAEKYSKPGAVYLGVVHRLLNKLFANKEAQKTYWAVVKNRPPKEQDSLIHWLKRNSKQNKSYAYPNEVTDSKKAILTYTVIQKLQNYYILEIDLHTGRHHQIRTQLSSIGCVIKGDLKYGANRSNKDGSIHLHARKLTFIHPVKKEPLTILAPPPSDSIWDHCEQA